MRKKIFLDTEVFKSNQFNTKSKKFEILKGLASINTISLHITVICEKEILKQMSDANTNIKKLFKKNNEVLYYLNSIKKFRDNTSQLSIDQFCQTKIDEFIKFRNKYLNIIDYTNIVPDKIFDAYFNAKPPFNKETKKHEFPDAISLILIHQSLDKNENAIIVSNDSDIESLVNTFGMNSSFKIYKKIENLLDEFSKESIAYNQFKKLIYAKDFSERIDKSINDIEFKAVGAFDPYIINFEKIRTDGYTNVQILEIKDKYIYFSFDVYASFNFDIEFIDADSWIYDSEDKMAHYFGKKEMTIDKDLTITFYVELLKEGNNWIVESFFPKDFYEIEFDQYEENYK